MVLDLSLPLLECSYRLTERERVQLAERLGLTHQQAELQPAHQSSYSDAEFRMYPKSLAGFTLPLPGRFRLLCGGFSCMHSAQREPDPSAMP